MNVPICRERVTRFQTSIRGGFVSIFEIDLRWLWSIGVGFPSSTRAYKTRSAIAENDWTEFKVDIGYLERQLSKTDYLAPENTIIKPKYNFLSSLTEQQAKQLKSENKALLLADSLRQEISFGETGFIPDSSFSFTVPKMNLEQVSITPNAVSQVAFPEKTTLLINKPSQVSSTQINFFPSYNLPGSILEVSTSEVNSIQFNRQVTPFQVNSTEIDISKIPTVISDINIGKISLPSSISSQQLLSSHSLSLTLTHDSNPQIVSNSVPPSPATEATSTPTPTPIA